MSEKIKAFIVNRNLLTTLEHTVNFLLKEPRVEIVIFDQVSSYPPLLEYYKNCNVKIIYNNINAGPHSVWGLRDEFNDQCFIVSDSDCTYNDIPDDWLDKMLSAIQESNKAGFSIDISNLPNNDFTKDVVNWESKYWMNTNNHGWVADIDTTFALYKPHSGFDYKATRLDKPYCMKHIPWYITPENINNEWRYYIDNASEVSTWGTKLKALL